MDRAQPQEQHRQRRFLREAQTRQRRLRFTGASPRVLPRVEREQELGLVERAQRGMTLVSQRAIGLAHAIELTQRLAGAARHEGEVRERIPALAFVEAPAALLERA